MSAFQDKRDVQIATIATLNAEVERLKALVMRAYAEGWDNAADEYGGGLPMVTVDDYWLTLDDYWLTSNTRAALQSNDAITPLDNDTEEDIEARTRYWLHKNHCNVGEYEGSCKYGDDDCPELAKSK